MSLVKKFKKNIKDYSYLGKLFKNCLRTEILKEKVIIFNTVKTVRDFIDREFFIGKILALNGAKVYMLLDDSVLNHWETTHERDRPFNLRTLVFKYIKKKGLKTYKDKNLEILWYSKIVDKRWLKHNRFSNENTYEYFEDFFNGEQLEHVKMTDWLKHAKASTIRYFKNEQLDWDDKDVAKYFVKSMNNCFITSNVGRNIIIKHKPDYFFTSHGIYSIFAPMLDVMKQAGVKSYVFVRGHSHTPNGSEVYISDVPVQILSRSKFWEIFKKKYDKLPKHLETRVSARLDKRFKHVTMDTEIYNNTKEQKLLLENKNPDIKYNIVIFPNVVWDGNIVERHGAFDGIMDWLISTINYFKLQTDTMVYIRFHPAEATLFHESEMTQSILAENIDIKSIKNLKIIRSEDNLDSYLFAKSGIDLAINYDTMMNLELPYLKVPVLCGATRGRFTIDGGDFTVTTREDYFDKLENFKELIQDFKDNYDKYYNNIIKYCYWYLHVIPFRHPVIKVGNRNVIDLKSVTKEDLIIPDKFLEVLDIHEITIQDYKNMFEKSLLLKKSKIMKNNIQGGDLEEY